MITTLILTAGTILGLAVLIGLYQRHRTRPSTYQVVMAQYIWQPRKYKQKALNATWMVNISKQPVAV